MSYVLKISDCDSFVDSFEVNPNCYDDKFVHVSYTNKPEKALTFDDVNEAKFFVMFIRSNLSSTDFTAESIGIYEKCYKEL